MGPDEFHDGYPDSTTPGLNNNAYTNIMAVWVLCRALEVLDLLSDVRRAELMTRLWLVGGGDPRWGDISPGCTCRSMTTGSSASSRATKNCVRSIGRTTGPVRQYSASRSHPRAGERQRQPLQALQTGRRADVVLPVFRRGTRRIVRTSGLSVRTRDHSAKHHLLCRPLVSRLHVVPCGGCLGAGAFRPAARDTLLRGGAAERRERCPAGHHRGGRPPRRHGGTVIWCTAYRRVSKYEAMFCDSIRNCRGRWSASTCAFATVGIHSICG